MTLRTPPKTHLIALIEFALRRRLLVEAWLP